jgi:hypothetical protein
VVQKSNWWSTVVAIAGGLALVIPGVMEALQPLAATKTGSPTHAAEAGGWSRRSRRAAMSWP